MYSYENKSVCIQRMGLAKTIFLRIRVVIVKLKQRCNRHRLGLKQVLKAPRLFSRGPSEAFER